MKLNLLDIEDYIKRNNILEVTSSRLYFDPKTKKVDDDGLWSYRIFGNKGSKERTTKFGYIDLKTKIIHPEVYHIILVLSPDIRKIITGTKKYIVKDGVLVESENGKTGIPFLAEIFPKLDLDKVIKPDRKDTIPFLKNNINKIFISKILVLPAGIRDFIDDPTGTKIMYSEINNLYESLLKNVQLLKSVGSDEDTTNMIIKDIQITCNKINSWIKSMLKGKFGVFRGLLLRKVTDFSGRCVITIDPEIPLGSIGAPWHILFLLYEPFCYHKILKDQMIKDEIKRFLGVDNLTIDNLKQLSLMIARDYTSIPQNVKTIIIEILKDVVKDKQLLYKRDSVVTRHNWRAGDIIITDTNSVVLNPLDLAPLRGDVDGDTVAVYSVFTKKANEEAKKLNPKYDKRNYYSSMNMDDLVYSISLDAVSTIYEATAG